MNKVSCNVCVEDFTSLIQCTFCNFEACKTCVTKYLLDSINEAHCMSCRKNFDREFLIKNISLSWYETKYKPNRKQVLFDRQKSLFPETMGYVELYKQLEEVYKEKNTIDMKILKYKTKLNNLRFQVRTSKDKNERIALREDCAKVQKKLHKARQDSYANSDAGHNIGYLLRNYGNPTLSKPEEKKEVPKFYGKCHDEKCIGLLNEKGVCVTCDDSTCLKCLVKLEEGHECDKELVETIKLIKNESKPCPNCHISIQKVSGCYQMWCTNCHTTYHSGTGEILNEKIHNPHYVEWLRNNAPKKPTNAIRACGERLDHYVFGYGYPTKNIATSMHNIMREVSHIEYSVIPTIRRRITKLNNERDERHKRCQFLMKELNEDRYKTQLFQNYKQTMRWTEVMNFYNFMKECMTSIIEGYFVAKDFEQVHEELTNLYKYSKEECHRIQKVYQNLMYVNDFTFENEVISFTPEMVY